MSFKQIYSEGMAARCAGKDMLDNPFFRAENFPIETASAYRAWQIKAEAWEQGWRAQDPESISPRSSSALQQNSCTTA